MEVGHQRPRGLQVRFPIGRVGKDRRVGRDRRVGETIHAPEHALHLVLNAFRAAPLFLRTFGRRSYGDISCFSEAALEWVSEHDGLTDRMRRALLNRLSSATVLGVDMAKLVDHVIDDLNFQVNADAVEWGFSFVWGGGAVLLWVCTIRCKSGR